MQKLRTAHLYLGCIFAPLLLFFAVSGIWQTIGMDSGFLQKLSTIHTGRRFKDASDLTSLPLRVFVLGMAVSFVITTVLGVVMAFKFGRSRRAAFYCLVGGAVVPLLFVVARMWM